MFLRTLSFLFVLSLLEQPLHVVGGNYSAFGHSAPIADRACTKDSKRYSLRVYAHVDKGVMEALRSASVSATQSYGAGDKEIVKSYLGTIIDSFNEYLSKFKVEIDLDTDGYDVDNFLVTRGFDNSCEVADPVITRTQMAHESLLDTYKGKVMGIHLFLWSCPYHNEGMADKVVVRGPYSCARSVGIMWDGTNGTVDLIKSALTEAISGAKNLFLDGNSPSEHEEDNLSYVCQHVDRCLSSTESANGVIIMTGDDFKNTVPVAVYNEIVGLDTVAIPPLGVIHADAPSDSHDDDCKY